MDCKPVALTMHEGITSDLKLCTEPVSPCSDRLLSSRALGDVLGVSKRRVNFWTQHGIIPAIHRSTGALYVVEDVKAALSAHGWRGNQKERRLAEDGSGFRACCTCGVVYPEQQYAPSSRRHGVWCCNECRRPSKRASDARRKLAKLSTQVQQVDLRIVAERDGWRCHICGGQVTRKNWSLDHVIPVSRGGPHTYANVALAHRSCNSSKGNRIRNAHVVKVLPDCARPRVMEGAALR
jgi:5-methylcytosine-specific restriction endonuclease McrA